MNDLLEQIGTRPDVVAAVRGRAAAGATARELADEVRSRLGTAPDAIIPVLWYFMEAFHLTLPEVLPLREELWEADGGPADDRIRGLIERTRGKWSAAADTQDGDGGSTRARGTAVT
jgi:hypothetical protein